MTDYEVKSIEKLGKTIHQGKWTNGGLVKLIKLAGDFLNIKTIPNYARFVGKSYPGVLKTKK